MSDSGPIQSVDRAVQVLEMMARDGDAAVGEVAAELGVHASTASRLISSLEAHDLVERAGDSGRVQLGLGLLRLAGAASSQLDLATQAQPICDRLAEQIGETVNVAVLAGDVAVNVCQADGTSAVVMQNWVGQQTVLHATSSGKVLLAYLDRTARESLIRTKLERFTDRTLTSARELRKQLRAVAEQGWASVVEEFEEGLNAVGAPIRGHDGSTIAAISAAGPVYRLRSEDLPEISGPVTAAADAISARMGYHARRR